MNFDSFGVLLQLIIDYIFTLFKWNIASTSIFFFVSAFVYAWAFTLWVKPYIERVRANEFGKLSIKIAHAFVLVIAIVFARHVVANAMKLPPQYFDITVSFVALITYIPAYFIFLTVASIVFFSSMLILAGTVIVFENVIRAISVPWVGKVAWIDQYSMKMKAIVLKAFLHAIGAAAVGILGAVFINGILTIAPYANGVIRSLAYIADFQPAGIYPGVPIDARIRLADNGVVSVARKTSNGIEINNVFYQPPFSTGADGVQK
jgi:hypothetical protein